MSKLIVPVLCAVFAAACSNQSPVAPSDAAPASGTLDAKPSTPSGVYDLAFFKYVPGTGPDDPGTYEEVSSLAVNSVWLTLRGRVTDSSGNPAQKGTVSFEYCSKGRPYDDINNADEMPMEACDAGTATWTLLETRSIGAMASCPPSVGGAGSVCIEFSRVQIPRMIGFRISYRPQGRGIAAGMSTPENFTWY
jgi:hypothetical protein